MSALAELQRQFQARILTGEPAILRAVESSRNVDAATRIDVYAQAYRLRLAEALASNFPRLRAALGHEDFAAAASLYIASHPSRFRSIRWVGGDFAAHLELVRGNEPWLADLARWEWAIAAAFDAPDAAPLAETELSRMAPDRWPALRFDLHSSAQVLRLATNAPALYKALADDETPPAPALLRESQSWLIWRRALVTRYRPLEATEEAALNAALAGASLEHLCDALCAILAPDEAPLHAAQLLKRWIADELIVGVRD